MNANEFKPRKTRLAFASLHFLADTSHYYKKMYMLFFVFFSYLSMFWTVAHFPGWLLAPHF